MPPCAPGLELGQDVAVVVVAVCLTVPPTSAPISSTLVRQAEDLLSPVLLQGYCDWIGLHTLPWAFGSSYQTDHCVSYFRYAASKISLLRLLTGAAARLCDFACVKAHPSRGTIALSPGGSVACSTDEGTCSTNEGTCSTDEGTCTSRLACSESPSFTPTSCSVRPSPPLATKGLHSAGRAYGADTRPCHALHSCKTE